MDERLKRRLVGGVLLIAVAWVVAALLPPPAPPGARQDETVVFDLRQPDAPAVVPGAPTPESAAEGATAEPATDAADNTGSETVPDAGEWPEPAMPAATPRPTSAPTPPPQRAVPTPTPARPTPPPPVAAPAPAGSWWVQVGAYSAREGAEQVRETLRVADLPARVESAAVNGRTIHRVRIGPYGNQAQAESAQARSVLLGYANATVLAP